MCFTLDNYDFSSAVFFIGTQWTVKFKSCDQNIYNDEFQKNFYFPPNTGLCNGFEIFTSSSYQTFTTERPYAERKTNPEFCHTSIASQILQVCDMSYLHGEVYHQKPVFFWARSVPVFVRPWAGCEGRHNSSRLHLLPAATAPPRDPPHLTSGTEPLLPCWGTRSCVSKSTERHSSYRHLSYLSCDSHCWLCTFKKTHHLANFWVWIKFSCMLVIFLAFLEPLLTLGPPQSCNIVVISRIHFSVFSASVCNRKKIIRIFYVL